MGIQNEHKTNWTSNGFNLKRNRKDLDLELFLTHSKPRLTTRPLIQLLAQNTEWLCNQLLKITNSAETCLQPWCNLSHLTKDMEDVNSHSLPICWSVGHVSFYKTRYFRLKKCNLWDGTDRPGSIARLFLWKIQNQQLPFIKWRSPELIDWESLPEVKAVFLLVLDISLDISLFTCSILIYVMLNSMNIIHWYASKLWFHSIEYMK